MSKASHNTIQVGNIAYMSELCLHKQEIIILKYLETVWNKETKLEKS